MNNNPSDTYDDLPIRIKNALIRRFSLRMDQADESEIDKNIRGSLELKGTYLWTLMCAILIASIGLNINSTTTIIGAMLISPLMGPIMSIGYGIGIYDFQLIRRAFKNLGIATAISFATSALYFCITPLDTAQSELLACTSPTIWDLLVALFGGMAGMIGITRKEKSNVIPGVAIATALMPPLCTAAYGFVHGNATFFFGALYLFLLNGIYITVSSMLIIWFIHPIAQRKIDNTLRKKLRIFLISIVFISFIPSVFIAVNFVRSHAFERNVARFIRKELVFSNTYSVDFKSSYQNKTLDIILVGKQLDEDTMTRIRNTLPEYGLEGTKLEFKHASIHQDDINTIKANLTQDILNDKQKAFEKKEQLIQKIQTDMLLAEQKAKEEKEKQFANLAQEVYLQYPEIDELLFSDAYASQKKAQNIQQIPSVVIISKKNLKKDTRTKLEKWLKFRLEANKMELIFIKR